MIMKKIAQGGGAGWHVKIHIAELGKRILWVQISVLVGFYGSGINPPPLSQKKTLCRQHIKEEIGEISEDQKKRPQHKWADEFEQDAGCIFLSTVLPVLGWTEKSGGGT